MSLYSKRHLAALIIVLMILIGCGGSGDEGQQFSPPNGPGTPVEPRPVEPISSFYKVHGLNLGPYLKGNPDLGDSVSKEETRRLLRTIQPVTNWVRTFGTDNGLEDIPEIAHKEFGLKVAMGVWLGADDAENEKQVRNAIETANSGNVDMVIVGSEVLLFNTMSKDKLIGYIREVRDGIPPGIPVTTADIYHELLNNPDVVDECDVVMANIYPYWEGVRVDDGVAMLNSAYSELQATFPGKEIIVSETGFPSEGEVNDNAVPSEENAAYYLQNALSWAYLEGIKMFYFEAFDEPWKEVHEGEVGAHWGIWYDDGVTMKPGMDRFFNGEVMEDNWSCVEVPGGPGQPEIIISRVPDYGTANEGIEGHVLHADTEHNSIVTYIRVDGSWWVKPWASMPLTDILCSGFFDIIFTTGGNDIYATEFVIAVIPDTYDPPILLGSGSVPQEVFSNSVAYETFTRPVM